MFRWLDASDVSELHIIEPNMYIKTPAIVQQHSLLILAGHIEGSMKISTDTKEQSQIWVDVK